MRLVRGGGDGVRWNDRKLVRVEHTAILDVDVPRAMAPETDGLCCSCAVGKDDIDVDDDVVDV